MTTTTAITLKLGHTSITQNARAVADEHGIDLWQLLRRHVSGDYGDTCAEDRAANEQALRDGSRVISWFGKFGDPKRLMIITDAETDVCPACWAGIGKCEPEQGIYQGGTHFRTDLPARRLTTTILLPSDY